MSSSELMLNEAIQASNKCLSSFDSEMLNSAILNFLRACEIAIYGDLNNRGAPNLKFFTKNLKNINTFVGNIKKILTKHTADDETKEHIKKIDNILKNYKISLIIETHQQTQAQQNAKQAQINKEKERLAREMERLIKEQRESKRRKKETVVQEEELYKERKKQQVLQDRNNLISGKKQLLSEYEIWVVENYFALNPNEKKISRKDVLEVDGKNIQLSFSVINTKNGLYAMYTGKHAGILGAGSYGRVKLAQNLRTKEIVAAKVQFDMEFAKKEEQNLNLFGKLKAETRRAVSGFFANGWKWKNYVYKEKAYTFSSFFNGISLNDYFEKHNSTEKEQFTVILSVLSKLQDLHSKGVVHGDLSFNNILINPRTTEVEIIDLAFGGKLTADGIHRLDRSFMFRENHYFAPEADVKYAREYIYKQNKELECTGAIIPASDIYNLGWCLQFAIQKYTPATNTEHLKRFIKEMLHVDPQNRASIQKLKEYCQKRLGIQTDAEKKQKLKEEIDQQIWKQSIGKDMLDLADQLLNESNPLERLEKHNEKFTSNRNKGQLRK